MDQFSLFIQIMLMYNNKVAKLINVRQPATIFPTLQFIGREKLGRGGSRPYVRNSGEYDFVGINIAPLNIFEKQVIPADIHNLFKSFRPNMATICVLSLGTKFIPKWRKANVKQKFQQSIRYNGFCEKTNQEYFVWTDNFD